MTGEQDDPPRPAAGSFVRPGSDGSGAGRPGGGFRSAIDRDDFARRAAGTPAMTVTRVTARLLGRSLSRMEVAGLEHLPRTGGVLLAANHMALVDGPLLYGVLPRPAVFLVKDEVFRGPVGRVLRQIGQIPVRRGIVERAPLTAALGTLAAGGVVGVFPQGTRGSADGDVGDVRHGIAYLAVRSGCPVVPVACHGTPAITLNKPWRRPRVTVTFGPPVTVGGEGRANRRTVSAAADSIRAALAGHVIDTRPPAPAATAPAAPPAADSGARPEDQREDLP